MIGDIRYAARRFSKAPGFTAVAVITLAVAIGACTSVFSVINGVLIRPLQYPDPDRLVIIRETQLPQFPEFLVSTPNFLDWHASAKSFSYLAAYTWVTRNLTTEDGEPQRLLALKVTADYFKAYGVQPALGRMFLPEEDIPGKNHVVVLSHGLWQGFFGGDKGIVGRAIQLNGDNHTVIGVAPPGFGSDRDVQIWLPMAFQPDETSDDNRAYHHLQVTGRLRVGVTVAQAEAEMKLIAGQLAEKYPDSNKGWRVLVMPLLDYSVQDVRGVLYTLLAAVGCVMLIACANVANLLLVRATVRQKEISIRTALGASRGRIVRELLTESVLLGLLGGLAGVLLAYWGIKTLLTWAPATLPRTSEIHLDIVVLGASVLLSVLTGVIFGLAPALLAARVGVSEALKEGTRGSSGGGLAARLRGALVVIEIAFALVLLTGAGLLGRSFIRLSQVDPGFNSANATLLRILLPERKYPQPDQKVAFVDALLSNLQNLPGVRAVGLAQGLPLYGTLVFAFNVEGRPPIAPSMWPNAFYYAVTPEYFRAMGIRLVRGRFFTPHDHVRSPRVAIINETLARQQFAGVDPIGKRILIGNELDSWREIVGIVADVKELAIGKIASSQCYEPFAQHPYGSLHVVIRTENPPPGLASNLRSAVYAVDKTQPVAEIVPLSKVVADNIASNRFSMLLLGVLAAIALVIAAVGVYAVMAYSVLQRTGEFAIRMALGAQREDVLRLVFAQAGKLMGAGLLVGLVATLISSRAIASLLFNTSAHDPFTLGAIVVALGTVGFFACLIPARKASKLDPMEALRGE